MCVVSFVIFPLGLCLLVTCISDVSRELIVLQLLDSGIFPLWLSEELRLQVSNSVFGSRFCVSQKLLMESARELRLCSAGFALELHVCEKLTCLY